MDALSVVKDDLERIIKDIEYDLLKISGSRFLITGAGGFLGYYLVNVLVSWNTINPNNKIIVYACDNFIRGKPQWLQNFEAVSYTHLRAHET